MKELKIYVDRLRNEQTVKIDETLSPDFLKGHDSELTFQEPVKIKGEAYLAEDHLVIHLCIDTMAQLSCSICNEAVTLPLQMKDLYLTPLLTEIPGAIFDLLEEIREMVLLHTPLFIECSDGKCPEREGVKQFFKKEKPASKDEEATNFPFADL